MLSPHTSFLHSAKNCVGKRTTRQSDRQRVRNRTPKTNARHDLTLFFTDLATLDAKIEIDGSPLAFDSHPYVLPPIARRVMQGRIIPSEMPFFLNDKAEYRKSLNAFLLSLPSNGCVSTKSWRAYAYDIKSFEDFLAEQTDRSDISQATLDHFDLFFRRRRIVQPQGSLADVVMHSTWKRQQAAFRKYFDWAGESGLGDKLRSGKAITSWRSRKADSGALKTLGSIKCISLDQYFQFRDLGLRGVTNDESIPSLRNVLRNVAFAELAITTGMRLEENVALLLPEIPDPAAPQWDDFRSCKFDLARRTTKGEKVRSIRIAKRVLKDCLKPYVEEERSAAVARADAQGRYAAFQSRFTGAREMRSRECTVQGDRGWFRINYDNLNLEYRQQLYRVDESGKIIEPAMLWLTESGLPTDPTNISTVFHRANEFLYNHHNIDLHVTPHSLRHTYAVYTLAHLIRATIDSVSNLRSEKKKVSPNAYNALILDPLRTLQRLMGHASQETTRIYLTYVEEADELADAALASWADRSAQSLIGNESYDDE